MTPEESKLKAAAMRRRAEEQMMLADIVELLGKLVGQIETLTRDEPKRAAEDRRAS